MASRGPATGHRGVCLLKPRAGLEHTTECLVLVAASAGLHPSGNRVEWVLKPHSTSLKLKGLWFKALKLEEHVGWIPICTGAPTSAAGCCLAPWPLSRAGPCPKALHRPRRWHPRLALPLHVDVTGRFNGGRATPRGADTKRSWTLRGAWRQNAERRAVHDRRDHSITVRC